MPRPLVRSRAVRCTLALVALAAAPAGFACRSLEREADTTAGELTEPDVFDVIRASNSKAAVEALRDRYEQEVEHARLLEARIGELIAAEEGLAIEHHERMKALQAIRDEVRALAEKQAATGRELDTLKQENAALEQAIAAERARREQLHRDLEEARSGE